jgi:UTP-glucose-1-phosphate uridylyltransferase
MTRLHDKRPGRLEIAPGETVRRTCGRYVCHPSLFEYIERVRPAVSGEFDEVPVYQEIVRERGAYGYVLPPPVFDVGHPRGYLEASAHLLASGASL